MSGRRVDVGRRSPHTYADPFLFVHADTLYLFVETVQKGGHGEITAYRTPDLRQLEPLGVVLSTPFHLSFPFVFADGTSIYMLPESGQSETLGLYQFESFPFHLRKVRTLLKGRFFDSHLVRRDGAWFLFTTLNNELRLYIADDLHDGVFRPHPASPITADRKLSRSAGSVLDLGGQLYRVAQDGSNGYGENVSLIEIQTLSPVAYRERVAVDKVFPSKTSWGARGGHHLNICEFLGRTVIAADGKQTDLLVNKFSFLWKPLLRNSQSPA